MPRFDRAAGDREVVESDAADQVRVGTEDDDAEPNGRSPDGLGRGRLLGAISTRIVGILREHYGRGPLRAKTFALDDIIMVVMRGSGFTPLEQTIMDDGGAERVVAMRHEFQGIVADRYTSAIEELTGRTVLAFLSQAHVEPDITIEIFFLDQPLECAADRTLPAARSSAPS